MSEPCIGTDELESFAPGFSKMSDDATWRRFERVAWRRLFPTAYAKCAHQKADADDLMQDLWLRVWEEASSFDASKGTLGGWLFKLLDRIKIDRHRRQTAAKRGGSQVVAETEGSDKADATPDTHAKTPEKILITKEIKEKVRQTVATLPGDFREVMTARLEEWEDVETAALLGISKDLVKTRAKRGRDMMRLKLQRDYGPSGA